MPEIEGVVVQEIVSNEDSRGYLREIIRCDDKLLKKFGQVMISKVNPGVIKAFHWHKLQDDLWYLVSGRLQVVLYDRRRKSKTYGITKVVVVGEDNPQRILIPKGVAHGYRVLGDSPAVLLYVVTQPYNKDSPDEMRIPFDDRKIGFDWTEKV